MARSSILAFLLLLLASHSLASVKPDDDLTFFFPRVPSVTLEKIQDVLTRAQELRERAQQEGQARAVAAAVAAAVGTLPPIQLSQSMRVLKMLPGEVHMHLPVAMELLARIRAMGIAAECRERHGGQGPPNSPVILIAANLVDCEEIMPFWILEVLRLALLLQGDPILQAIYSPAGPGAGATGGLPGLDLSANAKHVQRVGISVYESGSRDRTPLWLLVAAALWKAAGVPNAVKLNGTTRQQHVLDPATGQLHKQHRIQHLANLRNEALAPLYRNPGSSFSHVMFLNDIFFCATDLVRLTYLQADIACGVDVEVWIGGHVPKVRDARQQQNRGRVLRRELLAAASSASASAAGAAERGEAAAAATAAAVAAAADLSSDLNLDVDFVGMAGATSGDRSLAAAAAGGAGDLAASWQAASERMTKLHEAEAAAQAEATKRIADAVLKPRYEFYDIWASRDLAGHAFIKHDPIARDYRTIDLVHRGLPFPAKCCWNGAVYFNASHLSAGLRFRAGLRQDGECDASECSIFCEDYRRLGSGRVAVDPSVRVSYTPWTQDIHGPMPGGLPAKVPWSSVKRSDALERMAALWRETANDMFVECVPLKKGFDGADLDRVRRVDIRRENFTAIFLERQRQTTPPPSRGCNLIMGPYGAADEGEFFDDLSYASWGKNVITRIVHKASEYVDSFQVVYGTSPARAHGGEGTAGGGVLGEHLVEAGEFINFAAVYYDENAVHGMDLRTSVGRRIVIGNLRDSVRRALAMPCPSDPRHTGRYRLIAFAGTADRYLRSVTLLWS